MWYFGPPIYPKMKTEFEGLRFLICKSSSVDGRVSANKRVGRIKSNKLKSLKRNRESKRITIFRRYFGGRECDKKH